MTHAERIFEEANAYAASKGYHFGLGAKGFMQGRADTAGAEIDQLPVSEQAAKLDEANGNFRKLIDGMIDAAGRIPGYQQSHPGTIGEDTLADAMSWICPLWPFCD